MVTFALSRYVPLVDPLVFDVPVGTALGQPGVARGGVVVGQDQSGVVGAAEQADGCPESQVPANDPR